MALGEFDYAIADFKAAAEDNLPPNIGYEIANYNANNGMSLTPSHPIPQFAKTLQRCKAVLRFDVTTLAEHCYVIQRSLILWFIYVYQQSAALLCKPLRNCPIVALTKGNLWTSYAGAVRETMKITTLVFPVVRVTCI